MQCNCYVGHGGVSKVVYSIFNGNVLLRIKNIAGESLHRLWYLVSHVQ